ncbi:MAG: BON domain-containing protein [Pseudodesulfovibrio sp.]
MKKNIYHMVFVFSLALLLAGCALYPVVQVAGGALTGYDAVIIADDYIPRDHVAGGERNRDEDRMLERRLRERLKMKNIQTVSAHVFERKAYLVGQFMEQSQAKSAVNVAQSVQGLTTINCKFFPMSTPREAQNDSLLLGKLTQRIGETKRLDNIELRLEVIRSNAILIGEAGDYSQKSAALAVAAEVGGIKEVVDYIQVLAPPQPETESEKVALK